MEREENVSTNVVRKRKMKIFANELREEEQAQKR